MKAGVNDVSSLLSFSEKGIKKIEGIGNSSIKEIKTFLIQNDLKLSKDKKQTNISKEIAALGSVFINRVTFIPELCDMGKEIKLFYILFKKFPHVEFWANYETPRFKPKSLIYLFGKKGKEELEKAQGNFQGRKFMARIAEPNKDVKLDFSDEKLGEDIFVKKPSVEDFLND